MCFIHMGMTIILGLLNHIKEWLKTSIKRPSKEDVFSFINIWRTNSIQVLNLHDFVYRFWFCPSKHILEIYLKMALVLRDSFKRQEVCGNKANLRLKTKQTAVVPKRRSSISSNITSLRAKLFRGNINMCLHKFFVIPPFWHTKDNWNPSSYKSRTYLFHIVNIMILT